MTEEPQPVYAIGEVSKKAETSTRTIRYYEEPGLLNSVKRIENGHRIYTDDDIQRLKFIKHLKIIGRTLSEMHELESIWSIHKTNDVVLNRLQEILDPHLQLLEDRIADLNILRNEIAEYQGHIRKKIDPGKEWSCLGKVGFEIKLPIPDSFNFDE